MTVQQATRMWSRNGGSLSSQDGREFKASIEEGWQVVCDPTDNIAQVLDAPSLPRIGDTYPGTSAIYVVDKKPEQVSPIFFIVNVSYAGEFGPGGANDDPVNQEANIEWTDAETSEEIDQDFDGNPIVTANGEPIDGVTTTIADQVLSVERNFLAVNTFAVRQYRRATNSDTFLGWPPGTARLTAYSAKRTFGSNPGFWKVNAKIVFREPYNTTPDRAWYFRTKHEGLYVRVGSKIVRAVDDNKEPVTKPVLLNADGTRKTDSDDAHWLEIKRYGSLPYNLLGLV